MKKSRLLGAVCFCAVVFCFPPLASAEIIRHEFSGVINGVHSSESDPFDGQIQVGESITGFYKFDSDLSPRSECSDDCYWKYSIPPLGFNITVGTVTIETPDYYEIRVVDNLERTDYYSDHFSVSTSTRSEDIFEPTGWVEGLTIGMADNTGTTINDATVVPIDPSNFLRNEINFAIHGSSYTIFYGSINSIIRTPNPIIDITGGLQQECAELGGTTIEMTVDTGTVNVTSIIWLLDGETVGSTETISDFVGLGQHTVQVDVISDNGATGSDTVIIDIVDTIAPQVNPAFLDANTGKVITSVKHKANVNILEGVSDICDLTPIVNSVIGLPAQEGNTVAIKNNVKDSSISVTSGSNTDAVFLTVVATDASGNMSNNRAILFVTP